MSDIDIEFVDYGGEKDLSDVIGLIEKDLSEPYSIFTYRYFINNWSRLCINVRLFFLFRKKILKLHHHDVQEFLDTQFREF